MMRRDKFLAACAASIDTNTIRRLDDVAQYRKRKREWRAGRLALSSLLTDAHCLLEGERLEKERRVLEQEKRWVVGENGVLWEAHATQNGGEGRQYDTSGDPPIEEIIKKYGRDANW